MTAPLHTVLAAARDLLEQSLAGDDYYLPGVPRELTNRLRDAVKACGVELHYQRDARSPMEVIASPAEVEARRFRD